MPDGTVVSANGWYVAGTNEIWVDLNAGNFGEGTMVRTAAHEISHYIKQWSPKKWQAMADLLMAEFAKNDVNTESLLNRQIAKIKRRYTKQNMPSEAVIKDMAYEELVSDALSDMLTDGSIVNFIAEVKAKDRTLWQKIKDAVNSLLKKWGLIIDDYKGRELDTAEAQATLAKAREMATEQMAAARGRQAVMGGTDASIAQTQQSVNKMLADTMSGLAATGSARKDQFDQTYLNRNNELSRQLIDMYGNKAAQSAAAGSSAMSSLGSIGSSLITALGSKS
jgi:hypothetical protein